MPLYHFSDRPGVARFEPKPVETPVARGPGRDWLNGPLVWAIDHAHAFLYLFPRECPRILVWPTPASTAADIEAWFSGSGARALAFVERGWLERLGLATIRRYALPDEGFEPLGDVGMHVCRHAVAPLAEMALADLPDRLARLGVELRALDDFTPLRAAWSTSLHVSGLRLRNARGWTDVRPARES